MINWNNLDTVKSYEELVNVARVNLAEVMSGENGAERVKKYSVPMAEGMAFNYASKQVDDDVLAALAKVAEEMQLTEKFAALYNGEVINTGEKRMVLHHMTRGQLGDAVVADGGQRHVRVAHQRLRLVNAYRVHEAAEVDVELLGEQVGQVGFADAQRAGKLRQRKGFGEMERKVLQDPVGNVR